MKYLQVIAHAQKYNRSNINGFSISQINYLLFRYLMSDVLSIVRSKPIRATQNKNEPSLYIRT